MNRALTSTIVSVLWMVASSAFADVVTVNNGKGIQVFEKNGQDIVIKLCVNRGDLSCDPQFETVSMNITESDVRAKIDSRLKEGAKIEGLDPETESLLQSYFFEDPTLA